MTSFVGRITAASLRAVVVVLVALCCCAGTAVSQCTVSQWCWSSGWNKEYQVQPATATTLAGAEAMCTGVGGAVVYPTEESSLMAQQLSGFVGSVWALLDANPAVDTPLLKSIAPLLSTSQWDGCWNRSACCFALNTTTGSLDGVGCSGGDARGVACERSGTPTEWKSLADPLRSEYEYGYFTRRASFSDANASCRSFGGDLALLPASPSAVLGQLSAVLPTVALSSEYWVGFSVSAASVGSWTSTSVAIAGGVPIATASRCAAVTGSTGNAWTFAASACTTLQPFLCQRLRASNRTTCAVTEGASALEWAATTTSSRSNPQRRGYTLSSAIARCSGNGGAVTKFSAAAVTAMNACFGQAANLLTTVFGFGIWLDSSTAAIPSYFLNAASASCTYFNTSGPQVAATSCASLLPAICEYTTPSTLVVPATVTLGASCAVTMTATLSTPALSAVEYRDASSGGAPFVFPHLGKVSNTSLRFPPSIIASSSTLTLVCNASAAVCMHPQVAVGVTYTGIPSYLSTGTAAEGSNVLLDASYVPQTLTGWIGIPLSLQRIWHAAAEVGGINITVTFRVQMLSSTPSCEAIPSVAVLDAHTNASIRPQVHCDGGDNTTSFRILMSTYSNYVSNCTIVDYADFLLATVSMKLTKVIETADGQAAATTYYLFGPKPTATFQLSHLPSDAVRPTWVCLHPIAVNDTSINMSTFGGTACVASTAVSRALVLTFDMGTTTAGLIVVDLAIAGPAAASYDVSRSVLRVYIRLVLIPITFVSEIYELSLGYVFVNTEFSIRASIDVTLPVDKSLTVVCRFGNVDSDSGFPGVPPKTVYLAFTGASTNVSRITPTQTNNVGSDDKLFIPISLMGNVSAFFQLNTTIQRFRILSAMPFEVAPYIPTFLYLNTPFLMTLSVPAINPLRGSVITYGLSCGALCFGVTVTPASVVFSGTTTSRTFTMTGANIVSDVQFTWTMTASTKYVVASNFAASVRNRITVVASMFPTHMYYMDSVVYTARLAAQSPAPQRYATVSLNAAAAVGIVAPANLTTLNSIGVLSFAVLPSVVSTSSTSLSLPLAVSGPDAHAFVVTPTTLALSPCIARIQLTILQAPVFLIADALTTATITLRLDRAALVSANVTARLSASNNRITFNPPSVTWLLGDITARTVVLTTCSACADASTIVTVATSAVEEDGTGTLEAKKEVHVCPGAAFNATDCTTTNSTGTFRLPVIARSNVAFQTPQPIALRLNERLPLAIVLGALPFLGTLNVSLSPSSFLRMIPSHVIFTPNNVSASAGVELIGIAYRASEVMTVQLSGDAAVFYNQPASMCSYIDPTVAMKATPTNLAYDGTSLTMVSSQMPALLDIDFGTLPNQECLISGIQLSTRLLPTSGHILTVRVAALYEGFSSVALNVQPSSFAWDASYTPTTALAQTLRLLPTGALVEPSVTIVGSIFGNASSYQGFQVPILLKPPAAINVTFPSGPQYPREVATITVSLGRRVTVTTASITAGVAIASTNCSSVTVQQASVTFTHVTATTATLTFLPLEALLTQRCVVNVTVSIGGTALSEYVVPGVSLLSGEVVFLPRRRIFFDVPKYTFDRTFFDFNITLEQAPDAGTTVTFESSAGLGSRVVWTPTTPLTQPLSLAAPYLFPGATNVPLTLVGSSFFEQNRYESAPTIAFATLTKLTLILVGVSIRPYQVIGLDNAQTVSFRLSRAPLNESDVEATVSATSVIPNLLTFSPKRFRWSWNDTVLERTLTVSGNALGSAQDLQFVFASNFSIELGVPDVSKAILPSNFTVLERYTLSFSTLSSTMYVNEPNEQILNVTLLLPSTADISKSFNVTCSFTAPGVLQLVPSSVLVFAPGQTVGSRFQLLRVRGLAPGSGRLQVTPSATPELSAAVASFDNMQVLPLVAFELIQGGVSIPSQSYWDLQSDDEHDFLLSMSSYAADVVAFVAITTVTPVSHTRLFNGSVVLSPQTSVAITPTTFGFTASTVSSLVRAFRVACFTEVSTVLNITIGWTNTSRPQVFAPKYYVFLRVSPDWSIKLLGFPKFIYDGPKNTVMFQITLVIGDVPANATLLGAAPRGSVALSMQPLGCGGVATLEAQRQLVWTPALFSSPTVAINATFNASKPTCSVVFSKASPLIAVFAAYESLVNTSKRYELMTVETTIKDAPHLTTELVSGAVIRNRNVQEKRHTFIVGVHNGSFSELVARAPLLVAESDPILATDLSAYPVVITTDAALDVEPLGLLNPSAVPTFPFNFTTNTTHAFFTVNTMPNLILIQPRRITVIFNRLAFNPPAYPSEVGGAPSSVTITISKYITNVVGAREAQLVGGLSAVTFPIAALAAPSVTMILFQQSLVLQLFACPDETWQEYVFPFGTVQSLTDGTLSAWMTAAACSVAAIGGFAALHLGAVAAVHFLGKEKRFKKAVLQKYKDVANRFTVVAALLHFPTIPCVVVFAFAMPAVWYCSTTLINSTLPGYRVVALLLLSGLVVVFPILMHGVVWRSYSLEYIEYAKFHPLLGPSGFWWHPENPTYLPRYWVLLLETRRNTRWFLLAQYVGMCLISVVMAVQPITLVGCTARAAVVTSLVGIELAALAILRPFRIVLLNYLYIVVFVVLFAACIIITHVTTFAIRNDSLQRSAVTLLILHSVLTLLLAVAAVFSRCFAKPVPKAIAVLEHRQAEQRKKQHYQLDDVELADGVDIESYRAQDDGEDLDPDDDADDVMHPGHPLYDRDTIPEAPRTGQFRHPVKGFVTGGEMSFSPMRRRELASRSQLHQQMIDDDLELLDPDVTNVAVRVAPTDQKAPRLPVEEEQWSAAAELEGFPKRRAKPAAADDSFSRVEVRPSRLKIEEVIL